MSQDPEKAYHVHPLSIIIVNAQHSSLFLFLNVNIEPNLLAFSSMQITPPHKLMEALYPSELDWQKGTCLEKMKLNETGGGIQGVRGERSHTRAWKMVNVDEALDLKGVLWDVGRFLVRDVKGAKAELNESIKLVAFLHPKPHQNCECVNTILLRKVYHFLKEMNESSTQSHVQFHESQSFVRCFSFSYYYFMYSFQLNTPNAQNRARRRTQSFITVDPSTFYSTPPSSSRNNSQLEPPPLSTSTSRSILSPTQSSSTPASPQVKRRKENDNFIVYSPDQPSAPKKRKRVPSTLEKLESILRHIQSLGWSYSDYLFYSSQSWSYAISSS
ncbi:hypothetical protein C8R42DRAFT_637359 [Lentinula raphanica]|nr:hypothetical protein C8R42DRAFT_637359 [Lentinula raphanica]